ncbi:MAG: hypothetical protein AAF378_22780 [Cyanobacteria bacterium P01_A01_bin.84]
MLRQAIEVCMWSDRASSSQYYSFAELLYRNQIYLDSSLRNSYTINTCLHLATIEQVREAFFSGKNTTST